MRFEASSSGRLHLGGGDAIRWLLPRHSLRVAFVVLATCSAAVCTRVADPEGPAGLLAGAAANVALFVLILGAANGLARRFVAMGTTTYVIDPAGGVCEAKTREMFRHHVVRIPLAAITEVLSQRVADGGRIRLVCADGLSLKIPLDGGYYPGWDDVEEDAARIRALVKGGAGPAHRDPQEDGAGARMAPRS